MKATHQINNNKIRKILKKVGYGLFNQLKVKICITQ